MGLFYKRNGFICAFLDTLIHSFHKLFFHGERCQSDNKAGLFFFLSESWLLFKYAFHSFLCKPWSHLYPVACLLSSAIKNKSVICPSVATCKVYSIRMPTTPMLAGLDFDDLKTTQWVTLCSTRLGEGSQGLKTSPCLLASISSVAYFRRL